MSGALIISLLLALPLATAALVLALHRAPRLRDAAALGGSIATAFFAVQLFINDAAATLHGFNIIPNLAISFTAEPLGILFALIAGTLYPIATLYTIGYLRGAGEQNHTRFLFFYMVSISAAMGIALSGNLLTLFIFYELLTLLTYPLVIHKGTDAAHKAGRVYLALLLGGSLLLLLPAVIVVWVVSGSLEFTAGGILRGNISSINAALLLALFAFGIGKAALMPLHRWLPAAMVAPTPVSALLHAVAVVKAGAFAIVKIIIYIFGLDFLSGISAADWLVWAASFSLLAASFVALRKTNLKARLAYSTISQLAYITLGAAMLAPLAVEGAGLHLATHALGKITLFFCAGAIYVAHKHTDINEMDGLGRVMPFTYAAFAVASLSIIGIPLLGGAWSKLLLLLGAAQSGHLFVIGVLIISTMLNLYYLGEVVLRGFFFERKNGSAQIKEAPLGVLLPLLITAAACVALFFTADTFTPSIGDIR